MTCRKNNREPRKVRSARPPVSPKKLCAAPKNPSGVASLQCARLPSRKLRLAARLLDDFRLREGFTPLLEADASAGRAATHLPARELALAGATVRAVALGPGLLLVALLDAGHLPPPPATEVVEIDPHEREALAEDATASVMPTVVETVSGHWPESSCPIDSLREKEAPRQWEYPSKEK